MPIPDFQTLMLPVLRLADAGEIKVADAVGRIADEFALTDQEREELLPSGRQAKIANRVHWSVTYLVKSGLVERPRRGYFAITSKGKSVLSNPPERIDIAFLSQFDGFDEFRTKANEDHPAEVEPTQDLAAGTPEERVEAAFEDALAVVFDGADAPVARGHQGVAPGGELGGVGHAHAPAFMNQPRWSMKPAPKSRITRISTPSTSQPERLSTCGPSAPER